jgi:hypothetical protein
MGSWAADNRLAPAIKKVDSTPANLRLIALSDHNTNLKDLWQYLGLDVRRPIRLKKTHQVKEDVGSGQ